jgi:hypothetical protein
VNANLVRGLIRMGFYVGVHTEHGHDAKRLDSIVDALAAPVVAAMGDDAPSPFICGASRFPRSCARPPGHPGLHIAEDGFNWSPEDSDDEGHRCVAVSPSGERCVLWLNHRRDHCDGAGRGDIWPNEREG